MAKGKKTGGGSRKGIPNTHKSSFRTELWAYCESIGANPFHYMADMIVNDETIVYGLNLDGTPIEGPACKPEMKLKAAIELAPYLETKLKAMDLEISGNAEKPLIVSIRRAH